MKILEDFKGVFSKSNNALAQLILINATAFIALNLAKVILRLTGAGEFFNKLSTFLLMPPAISQWLYKPWTTLTYGFLHMDLFHILFNMLFLYWFGQLIQSYLGSQKLVNLYVLGVIAGGLCYLGIYNLIPYYAQNYAPAPLIGASAGVFAVVVGSAFLLPEYTFQLIFLGQVKIKYIALFYVLISLIRITGDNAGGELAHIGGAVLGMIYIKQLQQGRDWGRPIAWVMEGVKSLFNRPKIRVTHKNESFSFRSAQRNESRYEERGRARSVNQDEIDAILDKISERGYEALSKEEKEKLFNASK